MPLNQTLARKYALLLVVFLLVLGQRWYVGASREIPEHYRRFFRGLGQEIRACRTARKLSQEDMISYGFSVRHWQMMEAGRPMTVLTLLRVSEAFDIPLETLVASAGHHLRTDPTKPAITAPH